MNTVLAIAASCISSIGVSRIWLGKLDMGVILNATCAGGVSVGTAADLVISGGFAVGIGALAGIIGAVGQLKISAFLRDRIYLHDSCGVNNLHGMPGVLGGIIGAIAAACAESSFVDQAALFATFPLVGEGKRSVSEQAWMQFAALGITFAMAIASGIFAGFFASRCGKLEELFEDTEHFADVTYDEIDLQQVKNDILETLPDTHRSLKVAERAETEMAEMGPAEIGPGKENV